MQVPVKIYAPDYGVRHRYIFKLLFNELLGIQYEIIDTLSDADLNYSLEKGGIIQCTPYGILSETSIDSNHSSAIEFDSWDEIKCCFRTSDSLLPFDVFSASFYFVSRYEENLAYESDDHNRFPATSSILVKTGLIEEPLINQWALKLKDVLSGVCFNLTFNSRSYEFLSTIDIDQAWKFRNKGLVRHILGTFRDLAERKWENFFARYPVLLGFKDDPFYTFDWHQSLSEREKLTTHYFILLGNKGKYDKNISHTNNQFVSLIRSLNNSNHLGIHPSYHSNIDTSLVQIEIERLQAILKEPITTSRQHFLMHTMPQTYRCLLEKGITVDHTMGYSTHIGFRAGIAAPFLWFDLEANEATNLRLFPFCIMDITPLHYRKETPEEAIETIRKLLDKVKSVNGLFISLWHNESLSETERWRNWRVVYEQMVKLASKQKS